MSARAMNPLLTFCTPNRVRPTHPSQITQGSTFGFPQYRHKKIRPITQEVIYSKYIKNEIQHNS